MKVVHIIDGHALLAVTDVVRREKVSDVFGAMNDLVEGGSLLVARGVVDVLRRRDPNGRSRIWADALVRFGRCAKAEYKYQLQAQAEAQKAGYDEGLEDPSTERPAGTLETAALVLFWLDIGHRPIVVTEDWADKPLRPALEPFCKKMGWPTRRLADFLQEQQLGHCLS